MRCQSQACWPQGATLLTTLSPLCTEKSCRIGGQRLHSEPQTGAVPHRHRQQLRAVGCLYVTVCLMHNDMFQVKPGQAFLLEPVESGQKHAWQLVTA